MKRIVTALIAVAALAGCTTLEPPAPLLGTNEVYDAASPEHDPDQRGDKGGAHAGSSADPTSLLTRFRQRRQTSFNTPGNATFAQELFRSGVAVVRTRCDLYFRKLGAGSRNVRMLDRQIELLDGALVAAVALADTPDADTLAAIPLASQFLRGSSANVADGYLFSPDIQALKVLTDTAIGTVAAEYQVGGRSAANDHWSALNGIRVAQDVCTVHGIRYLVDDAVTNGTVVARYDQEDREPMEIAKGRLAEVLGGAVLTDQQVVLAYWHLQGGAAGAESCTRLPPRVMERLCENNAPKESLGTALASDLRGVFMEIDRLQPGWLATSLADYQAAHEAAKVDEEAMTKLEVQPLVARQGGGFTLSVQ